MTPELYNRAQTVFFAICDLAAEERAARLEERCAGEPELRAAVLQLLGGDANAASLEDGARGVRDHLQELLAPPEVEPLPLVANYEVLEPLGEGGFGIVFRAQQLSPVKRTVALKVVKAGMDSRQLLARFDAERHVLARMDHPGIARVLDAGVSGDGRPFFAMDFVDGEPLTHYCDERGLSIHERVELVIRVCRAVHHAHQKGVLHRDLKPANVLVGKVDGVAEPKVIDFGIARAMGEPSPGAMPLTALGQFIGTPEYMSPEQATGAIDPDVRSDVYSLGVLLYELLSGAPPFDFHHQGFSGLAEVQRVLRDVDPPRLSSRVADSTRKRVLKGDLDWIVLKALDKDPARRYDSALALADDLERCLLLMPVIARPPTVAYRVAKLVRRRRGAMTAAAAIVLLAIAGAAGTIGALIQARRAEREATAAATAARREASVSAAISAFLNRDLLYAGSPRGGGREITVRAALDRAATALDGKFPDYPEVEVALRLTLGRTFRHLGEADRAETQLRRGVELGRHVLAPGAHPMLEIFHELGLTLNDQRRFADALRVYDEALAADPQSGGSIESLRLLQAKAATFIRLGRYAEALPLLQDVLAKRLVLAPDDINLPRLKSLLGLAYLNMGRPQEALAELTEAETMAQRISGPASQDTLNASQRLAAAQVELGRYDDTEARSVSLVERSRRVNGAGHDSTLAVEELLADLRYGQGKEEEAEAILRRVLAVRSGNTSPQLADTLSALGDLAVDRGRSREAAALYREALETIGLEQARSVTAARSRLGLARALTRIGNIEEARSHWRVGHEMIEAVFPPMHWRRGESSMVAAEILIREERRAEARRDLEQARASFAALAPSSVLVRRLREVERALGG